MLESEAWDDAIDSLCEEVRGRLRLAGGGGGGGGGKNSSGNSNGKGRDNQAGKSGGLVGESVPVLIIQDRFLVGGWQDAGTLAELFNRIRAGATPGGGLG